MKPLIALAGLIDRINGVIGRAAGYAILTAILISAGNAVLRKLAPQYSSNTWLEAQWYLYGAGFLLAAALTLRENEHIRIDLIHSHLPKRAQDVIDLAGHILFLLPLCLVMLWYLGPYALRSFRSGELSTNAGGLPLWPAKTLLLAGFVMLTAQALAGIIRKVAALAGSGEGDGEGDGNDDGGGA